MLWRTCPNPGLGVDPSDHLSSQQEPAQTSLGADNHVRAINFIEPHYELSACGDILLECESDPVLSGFII